MLCDRALAKRSIVSEAQTHEQASSTNCDLTREDAFVTSNPDVRIFVRKVELSSNLESDRVPILLIHGGGPGSITSFDIDVPGYSVAADLAAKGHRVYLMNVRGWERSTRPASFNEPLEENPPAVTSEQAVLDISAVVDWINQQQSSKNGKKYWNARDITVPTLVIRGERDFWSRPADIIALEAELVNAPRVETETIANGTHYLFLDRPHRGRDRFIREVVFFLQE